MKIHDLAQDILEVLTEGSNVQRKYYVFIYQPKTPNIR